MSSLRVGGGCIPLDELGPQWAALLVWSTVELTFGEKDRQEVGEQSWECSSVAPVLPKGYAASLPWFLQGSSLSFSTFLLYTNFSEWEEPRSNLKQMFSMFMESL